jgi:prepilin signal peptidase PulO-like enzyme (type II secretory pathway)
MMEFLTGFLFLYGAMTVQNLFFLPLCLTLLSVLIVVMHYDIRHMVIPHRFVFIIGALAVLFFGLTTYFVGFDFKVAVFHIASAVLSFSFYGFLWLISKGKWIGLGDAKLAFALGLFLSPLSAFSMIVFSFWIGAAVSVFLLVVQKMLKGGKISLAFLNVPLTMKSEVPFAPFMVVAFILVFFGQWSVLAFLSSLF